MISAADRKMQQEVYPGEVFPARELLADMLLEMGYKEKALTAYQEDLLTHPNRFNGLYGAGLSAEKCGDKKNAASYYHRLSDICSIQSTRPELMKAKIFLNSQ
jgi:tetratricopeptide (TPR) repeat protein